MSNCPRCGYVRVPEGEKYCRLCRGKVLAEMKRGGYLTPTPKRSRDRPLDAQEDTNETSNGIDE